MHKDSYELDNKEDTIGQAVLYSDLHCIQWICFISWCVPYITWMLVFIKEHTLRIWCEPSKCNGILMKKRHTIGSDLMCGRWEKRLFIEIRQQLAWSNSHGGRLRKTSVFELFMVLFHADRFALKLMQRNGCCCLTHQEAAVFICLYYFWLHFRMQFHHYWITTQEHVSNAIVSL